MCVYIFCVCVCVWGEVGWCVCVCVFIYSVFVSVCWGEAGWCACVKSLSVFYLSVYVCLSMQQHVGEGMLGHTTHGSGHTIFKQPSPFA